MAAEYLEFAKTGEALELLCEYVTILKIFSF